MARKRAPLLPPPPELDDGDAGEARKAAAHADRAMRHAPPVGGEAHHERQLLQRHGRAHWWQHGYR